VWPDRAVRVTWRSKPEAVRAEQTWSPRLMLTEDADQIGERGSLRHVARHPSLGPAYDILRRFGDRQGDNTGPGRGVTESAHPGRASAEAGIEQDEVRLVRKAPGNRLVKIGAYAQYRHGWIAAQQFRKGLSQEPHLRDDQ
jgi:hypothetical protein